MTMANTLTHYEIMGRVPFEPPGSAYAQPTPSRVEKSVPPVRPEHGAQRPVIYWQDWYAQKREIMETTEGFWRSHTLDQLATEQNVPEASDLSCIMGAWPQDKLNDGFEAALRQWRDPDVGRHP
jgi:hypothetical protein